MELVNGRCLINLRNNSQQEERWEGKTKGKQERKEERDKYSRRQKEEESEWGPFTIHCQWQNAFSSSGSWALLPLEASPPPFIPWASLGSLQVIPLPPTPAASGWAEFPSCVLHSAMLCSASWPGCVNSFQVHQYLLNWTAKRFCTSHRSRV